MVLFQAPSVPLTGDANASQEKVEKLAGPLLEEYLHIKVKQTNVVEANKQIFNKQTTQRVLAYKGETNKYCSSKQTDIVEANIYSSNKQTNVLLQESNN